MVSRETQITFTCPMWIPQSTQYHWSSRPTWNIRPWSCYIAVFFDLEKAYDTTWKYGSMKDLHRAGLRGRLPHFIQGFLKKRQFQVRVGSTFSQLCDQEMGVHQGSILSVTLFGLKINSVVKTISPGVECSLICYRSKHIHTSSVTYNNA